MEFLTDSMQEFLNWLSTDQYGFWEELVAWVMVKVTIWKLEFMAWSIQFSWGVAQAVMDQLNLSGHLNSVLAGTDSYIVSWLSFFKVFEGLNVVLSSFVTKMVMRFMGWSS